MRKLNSETNEIEGVLQFKIDIPFDVKFVCLYLFEVDDKKVLIDAGLHFRDWIKLFTESLKEKDPLKSTLYAILGGIPLAALSMTWVKSQYLFVVIAIYAIIQIFVDIFRNKVEFSMIRSTSLLLFTGYILSLPVLMTNWGKFTPDINLFLFLAVTIFGLIYYFFSRRKIPWTLSMPVLIIIAVIALIVIDT